MIRLLLLSLIIISCGSDPNEVITEFNPGDEIIGLHSIVDISENEKYSEWVWDYKVMGEIKFSPINSFNGGTNGEFELNYILPGEDHLESNNSFPTIRVFFNWYYEESLSRWKIELFSGSFVNNLFNPGDPYYMIVTFSDGVYTMIPLPDQLYSDKLVLYFK